MLSAIRNDALRRFSASVWTSAARTWSEATQQQSADEAPRTASMLASSRPQRPVAARASSPVPSGAGSTLAGAAGELGGRQRRRRGTARARTSTQLQQQRELVRVAAVADTGTPTPAPRLDRLLQRVGAGGRRGQRRSASRLEPHVRQREALERPAAGLDAVETEAEALDAQPREHVERGGGASAAARPPPCRRRARRGRGCTAASASASATSVRALGREAGPTTSRSRSRTASLARREHLLGEAGAEPGGVGGGEQRRRMTGPAGGRGAARTPRR